MKILSSIIRKYLSSKNIGIWINRYLPATIITLVVSIFIFLLLLPISRVLASYAASIADTIIYYLIIFQKDLRVQMLSDDQSLFFRLIKFIRGVLIEFGPAEFLDTYIIRPSLFFYASILFDPTIFTLAITVILADLIFHLFAIIGFEINKDLNKTS